MLTKKRRQATERIARKRAAQFADEPRCLPANVPPPTRERMHKDPSQFEPGHFKKWGGGCTCQACKDARAKRSKGKGKHARREGYILERI